MRIIIADDHALFRGGIRMQLAELAGGAEIAEAASFDELRRLVDTAAAADLVTLDLSMPGPPWTECMRTLRARWPQARLVVVSALDRPDIIRTAIAAGANGFISKSEPPEVFVAALRLVLSGGSYFPASVLDEAPNAKPLPADVAVTDRQRAVLALLAEGCSNKEIAWRLGVTEGTVKLHVAAVLRSLGATNRTQAVSMARSAGLLRS